MPMTREEAIQSMSTIKATESLSERFRGYESAAPHLMIWGLVWAAGYGGSAAFPELRPQIWMGAIAFGAVSSAIAGAARSGSKQGSALMALAIAGTMAAFMTGLMFVLSSLSEREIDTAIPLIFAAAYALAGLTLGVRYFVCGVVIGAAAILGYKYAGPYLGYWMAAAGGGALFLSGLWMKRA